MRPHADLSLTHRLDALLRPAFLLALALLIANDWLFKPLFHNALTGKLSDFAGVYAFAYACGVLMARRLSAVHVAVAVAFVWWKSPGSSAAIAAWNAWAPWTIARVVDPWDLLALCMLPLSLHALRAALSVGKTASTAPRWPRFAVAAVALVAFTATSRAPYQHIDFDARYRSTLELTEMEAVVDRRGDLFADGDRVTWAFDVDECGAFVEFQAYPQTQPGSVIVVREAMSACEDRPHLDAALGRRVDSLMREVLHAERAAFPEPAFRAHIFPSHADAPRAECKDPRQHKTHSAPNHPMSDAIHPAESAR